MSPFLVRGGQSDRSNGSSSLSVLGSLEYLCIGSKTNSYVVIVNFWFSFYYDGRAEARIDVVFVGETMYPVDTALD